MSQTKARAARAVRLILGVLLAVLPAALFYVAAVVAQPQPDDDAVTPRADQPLLAPSPAVTLATADELDALVAAFPAPVLCARPGGGLTLTAGSSYDVPFEGGFGRMAVLVYTVDGTEGGAVTVVSVYPARALSLVERGAWHLTGGTVRVAGYTAARMTGAEGVRLHMQTENAVYTVTLPAGADAAALTRPLTLVSPEAERQE